MFVKSLNQSIVLPKEFKSFSLFHKQTEKSSFSLHFQIKYVRYKNLNIQQILFLFQL